MRAIARVSTNHTVVETFAALQCRSGVDVARRFVEDVVPVVRIEWVEPSLHSSALTAALTASRRGPSIVDYVSFIVVYKLSIRTAFAFDLHLAEQGFELLPEQV